MKLSFVLVFVFLRSLSCEEFSIENCPNAKNSIESDKVFFSCVRNHSDPCYLNMKFDRQFQAELNLTSDILEDLDEVFYEVTFTGESIIAMASGKAFVLHDRESVFVWTQMEGDMPVGHNGTATVNIFFVILDDDGNANEVDQCNPDYCVRTNITIVYD